MHRKPFTMFSLYSASIIFSSFYTSCYTHLFCGAEQLPDADKLFSLVNKSSFLDSTSSNTDIDWDKLAKSTMPLDSKVCNDTHTVPPPVSYEPQSAALKPTLGDPHEAALKERKRHAKDADTDLDGWCIKYFFIVLLCVLFIFNQNN